jgi:hypothetical protein
MPDLILESIGRVLAVLVRFDILGAHLESRERAPIDLKFDIAITCCVVRQETVQVC